MPKVIFSEDHNFTPAAKSERVSILYRAGVEYSDCTRECIEQAKSKGILVDGKGSEKVQSSDETDTEESKAGGAGTNR